MGFWLGSLTKKRHLWETNEIEPGGIRWLAGQPGPDIGRQVPALVDAGDLDALSGNPPPWVNADLESGTSREEWKGTAEANKILGR